MIRLFGVLLIVISLIMAYLFEKYDLFHTNIVNYSYIIGFFLGIFVFCISKPINKSVKSPIIKEFLDSSGNMFVSFFGLIASLLLLIFGIGYMKHVLSMGVVMISIGIFGLFTVPIYIIMQIRKLTSIRGSGNSISE